MKVRVSTAVLVLLLAKCPLFAQGFTVIALPDTQHYSDSATDIVHFNNQTQWIHNQVTGANPLNIQFVTHLGDVVQNGDNATEWARAMNALNTLETGANPAHSAIVPYSVGRGNHDGVTSFSANLGASRYGDESWYGGSSSNHLNHYQTFSSSGYDFLHLNLTYHPSTSELDWAQSVLDANPGKPTILSTHEYLGYSAEHTGDAGVYIWNGLVKDNDQIFMVLCGHNHTEQRSVSTNSHGRPVFEMLSDYQDEAEGGMGYLRQIELDIDSNQIHVKTYSPSLDAYQTDTDSQFTYAIEFADRFGSPPSPSPSPFTVYTFQQNVDGYTGTEDKEIRSSGGDADNGENPSISIDGDDGSPDLQPNHGLIRFNQIVGSNPEQIPAGTTIESATLSLNVVNPGSGMQVYQLVETWDESTTWTDFGGDGVTPGDEALIDPIIRVGADNSSENVGSGTLELDVTRAVQAWVDGVDNEGVGLMPFSNGTNGIDLTTSESTVPPVLTIRLLKPGITKATFQQGVDGYGGARDTALVESEPFISHASDTTMSIDGDAPGGSDQSSHGLLRFDHLFGGDPGQIPTGDTTQVLLAELILEGLDSGSGAILHRLLQDWNDTDTWDGAFGGDGVQADGTEAALSFDASTTGPSGRVVIDVTNSIKAWLSDPSSNRGWVLFPMGTDGWDFYTSEGDITPLLQVYYEILEPSTLAGDMNGDGSITNADINPFVLALTDPEGYAAAFPDLDPDVLGDLNDDGLLTNADINPFVQALVGEPLSAPADLMQLEPTSVPEPASLALLGLGGLALLRRRKA